MDTSTSPDVSGIKISADTYTDGAATGNIKVMGHVDSVGSIISKSRNTTKQTPINDTQFEEIVSLGSLTNEPFNMTVLYDPEGVEGINLVESALDNNEPILLILELNNSKGSNGTTINQKCKISKFSVDGAKDDKYKASFTAERIGQAEVIPAA